MFSLQDEHDDDGDEYGDDGGDGDDGDGDNDGDDGDDDDDGDYGDDGDAWNKICAAPAHILNILTLQGIFDEQLVELLDLVPSRKGPAKCLLELNFDNQKCK